MTARPGKPVEEIAEGLVTRLKHPWAFALLAALLVADLLIPDPIPFVDELVLALLTVLVGSWRTSRKRAARGEDASTMPAGDPHTPRELGD